MSLKRQQQVRYLRSSAATLALLAAFAADHALAQSPVPEEIIVTGSRIARPGLTAPNPVTVLNSEAIALTGLQQTVEILAQLPQAQVNMTPSNNQGFVNGVGVAFTNLRGIGEYRTLTLVDGRRHVGSLSGRNGSGGTSLVDINMIPAALIERVEIVTGGASAIYGADAVAGVVNFILKKNYEGAEITAQYGAAQHGGAVNVNAHGLIGSGFAGKRGNITLAFDYDHDGGLLSDDRDYALCGKTLVSNPANFVANDGIPANITSTCYRSSIYAKGATIQNNLGGRGLYGWTFSDDGSQAIPFNRGTMINPPGTRLSGAFGTSIATGGEGRNTLENAQLRTPHTRMVVDTLVNYGVAEKLGPIETLNFFTDIKYGANRGTATSSPNFNGTGNPATGAASSALLIAADNPYIPANLRSLVPAGGFNITRYNEDWGNRTDRAEYEYFRAVVGFNGEFKNGWKYEVSYNYGRNETGFYNTDRYEERLREQLDAVVVGGQVVCRDEAAQARGCVPINPFRFAPLSPAQAAYSYVLTHENDVLTQQTAGANVSGDLFRFQTPFSGTAVPVGFAAGFEWRKETGNSQPDYLTQQGLLWGNQNAPVVGQYDVREYFAELNLPLLRDLPFVKSLDLDGAYRFSDYSTAGTANTWNVRANWAITSDIKLRGSSARAVRAPNIDELFAGFGEDFSGVSDPCSSQNINNGPRPASRLANCRAAGVPASYNSGDYPTPPVLVGGNTALRPEIARTWTAGFVLTPSFIPGLSVTADYWFIKIRNGIQTLPRNAIINNCYDNPGYPNAFCNLVRRRADGSLVNVVAQVTNIGQESVRGLDFEANYSFDLDRLGMKNMGSLGLAGLMTWVPQNTVFAVPGDSSFNLYRSGVVGYPHLKGQFRATWDLDNLTASLSARYIGPGELLPAQIPDLVDFNQRIGGVWYFDLAGRYRWNNVTLSAGMNNMFDKKPPQVPFLFTGSNQSGAFGGNASTGDSASTYSNVGRYFFIGATVKF